MSKLRYNTTIDVSYNLALGNDTVTSTQLHQGDGMNVFEIICGTLSATDGKLILQTSLNGISFKDAEDASGNLIYATLESGANVLQIYGLITNYFRFRYEQVTPQTGTIQKINCLFV
jgi:hypothetical protein